MQSSDNKIEITIRVTESTMCFEGFTFLEFIYDADLQFNLSKFICHLAGHKICDSKKRVTNVLMELY